MDIVGYVRRFLAIFCIIFLASSIAIPSVFSAGNHGCAPATPPPVPGTLVPPEARPHVLFINEVLSNPGSYWNCSEQGSNSGKNNAWVELYNPQNQALDLYTVHGSLDSGPNTTRSYFPLGTAIPAHGFLVIFPPVSIFAQAPSTDGSATLRLLIGDNLVDQVTLLPLVSDTSYARMPDGGSTWHVTDTPTINTSNVLPTAIPTPTRTPKASQAKTDSSNQKGKSTNNASNNHQGATSGTSNRSSAAKAKQPEWKTLQVPTTKSLASETTTERTIQGNIPAPAPQAVDKAELPRKILLTLVATALALTLFWCGRLFIRG